MDIKEIIAQEEAAFKASNNIAQVVKMNKAEILLPFAMKIFDFLEIIQNDPAFVFTSDAHPSADSYTPLFSSTFLTLEYYRGKAAKEIEKHNHSRVLTRSFSYGRNGSRYMIFGIGEDFKPYFAFTTEMTPKQEEKIFSTEEAIRVMMKFFLSRRK